MSHAIAIVGSVDSTREEELKLTNLAEAPEALVEVGRALAEAGFSIVVYSSEPGFIEEGIVKGYVGSGKAKPSSIDVRHPPGTKCMFAEMAAHGEVFDDNPDVSDSWEVSFYRSLAVADGVLLVGGGKSTLIAGLVALGFAKPLVAIHTFGGQAVEVRRQFGSLLNDAKPGHLSIMGRDWSATSAVDLVGTLREQIAARKKRLASEGGARRRVISLLIGIVALLAAIACVVVVQKAKLGGTLSYVALFAAPMLGGLFGAIIRNAQDRGSEWLYVSAAGLGAGALATLVFIASQLITSDTALKETGVHSLVMYALATGIGGGYAFEAVWKKVRERDPIDLSGLDAT